MGFRPGFLSSRPYFRVCVLVAVILSTEASLYLGPSFSRVPHMPASPMYSGPTCARVFASDQGPENTHKYEGIFSGSGVLRFTGGYRPQGNLPRLTPGGFCPVFRRSGIRGIFLYVSFLHAFLWRLIRGQNRGQRRPRHVVLHMRRLEHAVVASVSDIADRFKWYLQLRPTYKFSFWGERFL